MSSRENLCVQSYVHASQPVGGDIFDHSPHHGGHEPAVERKPALLAQHHARAVRNAAVCPRWADRQPRADQLQRVNDGL